MNEKTSKFARRIVLIVCSMLILLTSFILCAENIMMGHKEKEIARPNIKRPEIQTEIAKTGLKDKTLDKSETIRDFNWVQDMSSSIGTITIEDSGRKVSMTGNPSLAGKNAIYIIPENHQEQTFTFTYSVTYGDSFIGAGVLLKVKKVGNTLTGYMLSFNKPGQVFYTESGNQLGAIWKFTYTLGNNSDNTIARTLVKALEIPVTGTITVKSTAEQIILTGANINETLQIGENEDVGDGFGFFSAHYSHNCSQIGSFTLDNFAVTTVDLLPHSLFVDPNGGTWNNVSTVTEIEGIYRDIASIPMPTRSGYTFAGWTKRGNSGTMSTLTGSAVYTFGEDEETDDHITAQWVKIDAKKQADCATDVVEGQEVTYTITANNTGTTAGTAIIKDAAPEGTTFIENSIKVNGVEGSYTEQDLNNGITIPSVGTEESVTVSFKVRVNQLTNGTLINNKAEVKERTDVTTSVAKESNNVQLRFVEPIISQSKSVVTQYNKPYVVVGEKVTYSIHISNDGFLGKDVIVKDTIPSGTTFVEGSIQLNGTTCTKPDGTTPTSLDLANGIGFNIGAEAKNQILSFEVTINDIEDEDIITNIATVDKDSTNIVSLKYSEPIISQRKEVATQYEKDYVVNNEKLTYSIIVENDGSLEKNVIVKDIIPKGTTFVEGSIKVNGESYVKKEENVRAEQNEETNEIDEGDGTQKDNFYHSKDLAEGIEILVPAKVNKEELEIGETKNYIPGKTILSFEVTVDDIEDEDIIENVASVDEKTTNTATVKYIEPVISQRKEATTEYEKNYVAEEEKITYHIVVENDGSLEKNVMIKDMVPKGTSFVEGSIKVNNEPYLKKQNTETNENNETREGQKTEETIEPSKYYTAEDLRKGIEVLIPAKAYIEEKEPNENEEEKNETEKEETSSEKSEKESEETEGQTDQEQDKAEEGEITPTEPEKKKYLAGKATLSFQVTVDQLEKGVESAKIVNVATVDEKETNKVEHTALPFNMKVEKQIKSFLLNGKEQLGKNNKLMKIEIVGSKVSKAKTKITYSIVVTNTGKIAGTATVIDTIPEGYEVEKSNPSYWNQISDGKLETTTETLAPGVSKELKVVLKWKNKKDNFGPKVNKAEITETKNESNAKEKNLEDNVSEATVVMSIKTGTIKDIALITIMLTSGIILVVGILLIKKSVLDK